ncbi:DUF2513 domain-containing protein [Aeromonas veronii]|uniref:DUF2513 domain-containing protein n=1 Tax=Aeromonas veronii TaxID=654 RepID=A0ABY3MRV9_AERVE|nr:DUF2513 domain-containing protein [Aeromonas veronii]MCR3969462.1 DUF2513 domain-containing protein [Aeromonas veronii]MCR3981938.1 DUF2513 domain-containing protein [Aeromonas veronii]RDU77906.1 hypothetical protein CHF44_21390 [Aeromonas veronii]RDU84977.1 hypothetical protein CGZ72_11750 [Aeromonas veronii]RDU90245.1 hypothetical protein CGZ76_03860 [Aeromonas veronii]
MKRNWDTIRLILTKVEGKHDSSYALLLQHFEPFDNLDQFEISYHVRLMLEIGLIEGKIDGPVGGGKPATFVILRLTWAGHEFLDSIRSDTVWSKTKETFVSRGLDMTFETIKTVVSAIGVSMLGRSL